MNSRLRHVLRFIIKELNKPYGWPGIIMLTGLLLVIGGGLYRLGEWLAGKAWGWWG